MQAEKFRNKYIREAATALMEQAAHLVECKQLVLDAGLSKEVFLLTKAEDRAKKAVEALEQFEAEIYGPTGDVTPVPGSPHEWVFPADRKDWTLVDAEMAAIMNTGAGASITDRGPYFMQSPYRNSDEVPS